MDFKMQRYSGLLMSTSVHPSPSLPGFLIGFLHSQVESVEKEVNLLLFELSLEQQCVFLAAKLASSRCVTNKMCAVNTV